MTLCFASGNSDKLAEIAEMAPNGIEIKGLGSIGFYGELEEDQTTLEGNALQKAQFVYQTFGIPCFADDTGLEVDALGGEPGVYSARYAGEERDPKKNMTKLLELLGDKPRGAQFRTVIALVGFHSEPVLFEGLVRGRIGLEPVGTKGFGYDPIFIPDGFELTFAELDLATKNQLSHRGKAFRALMQYLNPV